MTESRLYKPSKETFKLAAKKLKQGDILSFPTETVYGLGADATNSRAVAKIFSAKSRPSFNPLIVHLSDAAEANQFVEMSDLSRKLANTFWPGPFTMVIPLKEDSGLSDLITAGINTVAIRVPQNNVAQELLIEFGGPIAAPSANKSGRISPTTAQHVDDEFSAELGFIIDGGPCKRGIESTIVQIKGDQVILLRPGSITAADIENVIGSKIATKPIKSETPNSPGQLESHYAPNTQLRLNITKPNNDEGFLTFGPTEGSLGKICLNLSPSANLEEAAANLFSMMRELDNMNFPSIAVSSIPEIGLGLAINDRLRRAAAPKKVD